MYGKAILSPSIVSSAYGRRSDVDMAPDPAYAEEL